MYILRFRTGLKIVILALALVIIYLTRIENNYLFQSCASHSASDEDHHREPSRGSFVCGGGNSFFGRLWQKRSTHPAQHLKQYCSKIPNPIDGWQRAERYKESDVAFLIATGAPFYRTRARAVRETWASRVTNYYFLSSVPYPSLPVTIIENTGEDYQSNTKKIFLGLEMIYKSQQKLPSSQRHKWYFLVGCDTYVNVPYFLKRLENYDYRKPYFLGGSTAINKCFHKNGTSYDSVFVGGNTAHVFSAALMESMYPHLSDYVLSVWPQPNHTSTALSDVALSCLIFSLGHNMTILSGFWRHTPDKVIEEFGLEEALSVKEPSSWHYSHPAMMMDLDEFYAHEFVDRLKNDHNWKELVDFTRLFVTTHYALLRKTYAERRAEKT